ncbi:MAG: PIN domain-containing protein [Chlamydiia bacterium]|nr:PIN domain-containing protein [Chlamydiia bacterium]
MKILIDTTVWSLAFRKNHLTKSEEQIKTVISEIVLEGRAVMIGPIRLELLSGIKHPTQFEKLKKTLRAFPDLSLTEEDFELAAEFFNRCRSKGVQGSHTDFLICAVAKNHYLSILTIDRDFVHYSKHLPIQLYQPRLIS